MTAMLALLLAFGLLLAGCDIGANSNSDTGGNTFSLKRYETVPVPSPNSGRAVEGSDAACVLVNSGYKESAWYYLYYLGYVKNVPIAYKTQYVYEGIIPLTITVEKNWVNEETITQSTTKTREHTTTTSVSGSVEVGVEAEAGAIFAKAKVTAKLSTTVGGEWANTVSTADTLETATAKAEGESESISATIGDHEEPAGTYRYTLFGVTDVYVLFKVNAGTREIEKAAFTTCARESSYAWGIDFDPSAVFGKSGPGDLFKIPYIDFSEAEAPTEELEDAIEPPQPPSETITTAMTTSREALQALEVIRILIHLMGGIPIGNLT
jgi:hypothetical protein